MINKLFIFFRVLIAYWKKIIIDCVGLRSCEKLKKGTCAGPQLVVTLTSYGRRVSKTVYYTIVSILRQTSLPDRIVLWLDEDHWNELNIPVRLKKLQDYGLEIKFCKDIGSYTKLIRSIEEYPNDILLTIDDDVIYNKKLIQYFRKAYECDPKRIWCAIASAIKFDDNGKILPYQLWRKPVFNCQLNNILPWGVWGCLYPPHSLYKDVCREDLFMSLCPKADDVWFWCMAQLQGTNRGMIDLKGHRGAYSFDDLYQCFHQNSALTHQNDHQNKNDIQLRNLISYYNILIKNN